MPYVIIILLFTFFAFGIWKYVGSSNALTINFNPHSKFFKNRLRLDQVNILSRYSKYYRSLPEKMKSFYEDRIINFIDSKEFILEVDLF